MAKKWEVCSMLCGDVFRINPNAVFNNLEEAEEALAKVQRIVSLGKFFIRETE